MVAGNFQHRSAEMIGDWPRRGAIRSARRSRPSKAVRSERTRAGESPCIRNRQNSSGRSLKIASRNGTAFTRPRLTYRKAGSSSTKYSDSWIDEVPVFGIPT